MHSRILVSGLFITLACLPFSQFGTSLGAILVALSFITAVIKRKALIPKHPLFAALIALFAWTVLGLVWTTNIEEELATLNIKLPLLIFPLALFTVKWDSKRWLKTLAVTYIIATFGSAIVGLINGYFISSIPNIKAWSPFISHIRMGLMLALGLGILLLNKRLLAASIYGAIALLSIWNTQSVTGTTDDRLCDFFCE